MTYYGPVEGGGVGQWLESRETTATLGEWLGPGPTFDPLNEPPADTGGSVWTRSTYEMQPPSVNFPRATGAVVDHGLTESAPVRDGYLVAGIQRFASASALEDDSAVEYVPQVSQLGTYGVTDPDRYIPLDSSYWPDGAIGIEKLSDTEITSMLVEVRAVNVTGPPNPDNWYASTIVSQVGLRPGLPADGFPNSIPGAPDILPTGAWETIANMVGADLETPRYFQFLVDWYASGADQVLQYGVWLSKVEVRTTYGVTFGEWRFIYEDGEGPGPTVTPPLRQVQRGDGLGLSGARRAFGNKSQQASARRAGGFI